MKSLNCKKCNKIVEVKDRATIIVCDECRIKKGESPLEKRDYDTNNFIFCRICGTVKRRLDSHIKQKHKITVKEYLKQFPEAPIFSKNLIESMKKDEETKAKMSRSAKKSWENEEIRQRRIDAHSGFVGETHSEETKRRISKSVTETKAKTKPERDKKRYEKIREEKKIIEDFIICPLCFKETNDLIMSRVQYISFSHLQKHGYTVEQFQKEYPGSCMKIKSLGKKHSEDISGEKHFNFGKELSEETKNKISGSVLKNLDENKEKIYKHCLRCNRQMRLTNKSDICNICIKKFYRDYDSDDAVYCRVCYLLARNLTKHLKDEHNVSSEEYKKKYNAPVCCKEFCEGQAEFGFKTIDYKEVSRRVKLRHEKEKEQKIKWEKNFNKNDYVDLMSREIPKYYFDCDSHVFCRICYMFTSHITPKHLFSHKMTMYMYREIFPNAPLVCSDLAKYIGMKSFKTKIARGQMSIGESYGYGGTRKDVGHYTRSMVEANFSRILKFNNISYLYEPDTFELKNSRFSSITPDFRLFRQFCVWKKGSYVETKGYMSSDDIEKIDDFIDEYPHIDFNVLSSSSQIWKELEYLYRDKIPLWEDSNQNIRLTPHLYKLKGD